MKIWHQSMTELHDLGTYKESLEAHAKKILGTAGNVEVHGMPKGAYHGYSPTAALSNAFAHHRILDPILDNAVRAEMQGFDAFIVGSYSEPFIRELRSAVDIPVVSITEATLLVSCSIGRLSAPIANDPGIAWIVRQSVESHGMSQRVLTPRAIEPALNEPEMAEAFAKPEILIGYFQAAARRAIEEGADVIIPAEGVLSEFLYNNQINMIDGVPVLDSFGVVWTYAAMMINLREKLGLSVSRKMHYQRNDPELITALLRK
jgi:allantoin racemase